jgi:hypothetical protein
MSYLGEAPLLLVLVWATVGVMGFVVVLLARSAPSSLQTRNVVGVLVVLASRRAGSTRPGRACPVQMERPTGRTTWTGQARSGYLWCAAVSQPTARHPGVARVQGRMVLAAGGLIRVVGLEALPAGGNGFVLLGYIACQRGHVH